MSATASATSSSSGAARRSTISRSCRRAPASATRSTSSISRRCVWTGEDQNGETVAYPDTLVGTDSHTTMVNGLGVLGWGVGGIEAEAAMLGQPVSMLIPEVVGFRLRGELKRGHHRDRPGADRHPDASPEGRRRPLRRILRARPRQSAARRPRDDRQHGARIWRDLRLLPDRRAHDRLSQADRPRRSSRSRWSALMRRRRACGATPSSPEPLFTDTLELDMGTIEPSLAGPKRPQDRVLLSEVDDQFNARARRHLPEGATSRASRSRARASTSATATSRSPRSPAAPTPRTRRC